MTQPNTSFARRESRAFTALSWVTLGGALLVIVFLLSAIGWLTLTMTLSAEGSWLPDQARALIAGYGRILLAGFVNPFWALVFLGVLRVWWLTQPRDRAARRLALGLSLIIVQHWLQLTVLFLLLFGRPKTQAVPMPHSDSGAGSPAHGGASR